MAIEILTAVRSAKLQDYSDVLDKSWEVIIDQIITFVI
jgi:hypothetical protein